MPNGDLERLASYVIARRLELGYRDRAALEAATGITARTLGKIETGRHVGAVTLAELERALKWEPDSARTILRGGDPRPRLDDALPAGLTPEERRAALAFVEAIRARENSSS
jgi:transcriptional regulator with XRE-family HTH domain